MIRIQSCKYKLKFKFEAGTSRGTLKERDTWVIRIIDHESGISGIGECAPLNGLSAEYNLDFETHLAETIKELEDLSNKNGVTLDMVSRILPTLASIKMGIESGLLDYLNGGKRLYFDNGFFRSQEKIPINGLVWMGSREQMQQQIRQKIDEEYSCIKMKIGAIDFDSELSLLKMIRSQFGPGDMTLRVDANGSFSPEEALSKLERLSVLKIHSIEQPIRPELTDDLALLCRNSPVPVALDESLIGNSPFKEELLDYIKPSFVVLKPTLLGGFLETEDWIRVAESKKIGWWITSALESNIGLNALAQFTANYNVRITHGLGTGQLYTNNFHSPVEIRKGHIIYSDELTWDTDRINALFD